MFPKLGRRVINAVQNCIQFRNGSSAPVVLGIETSCDDTGAALVDSSGNILGSDLCSQQSFSTRFGGVIPTFARSQHEVKIASVVSNALSESGLAIENVDAIAVTTKPGLPACLKVGVEHAIQLCRSAKKPLISVHHMAAHATVIRLTNRRVAYPFLALLISGGHSIITLVQSVNDYLLLGSSLDTAPGEAFDKVSRRLNLCYLKPEYEVFSGGRLIQVLAAGGDPMSYSLPYPNRRRDCNFSFAGLTTAAFRHIERHETATGGRSVADDPTALKNLCASFQHAIFRHIAKKLLRAMVYVDRANLLQSSRCRQLVVSGGVACNEYIRNGLGYVCENFGYASFAPPPPLCTDNGIMIAWLGMEKYLIGSDVFRSCPESIEVESRHPIGKDLSELVYNEQIPSPRLCLNRTFF